MPVKQTVSVEYTLMSLSVDMAVPSAAAIFHAASDGAKLGEIGMGIPSGALMSILGVTPSGAKTRADDITDAIYEYAIATGVLPGGS